MITLKEKYHFNLTFFSVTLMNICNHHKVNTLKKEIHQIATQRRGCPKNMYHKLQGFDLSPFVTHRYAQLYDPHALHTLQISTPLPPPKIEHIHI